MNYIFPGFHKVNLPTLFRNIGHILHLNACIKITQNINFLVILGHLLKKNFQSFFVFSYIKNISFHVVSGVIIIFIIIYGRVENAKLHRIVILIKKKTRLAALCNLSEKKIREIVIYF